MTATKYGEKDSYYGNSITEDTKNKGAYLSSFNGNEFTGSFSSMEYSQLGALEYCAKRSEFALMSQPVDESTSSTTLNAYSNSYRLNNKTTYTNYNIVPVTTTYPRHTIVFQCKGKMSIIDGMSDTEQISREMVHAITKDFKAGVQLKDIDTEEKNGVLQFDDIIIKVNGVRTENLTDITEALEKANKKSVPVGIIRDSKIKTVTAKIRDVTYVIKNSNQKMASNICSKKPEQGPALRGGATSATAGNKTTESVDKEMDPFRLACKTVNDFLSKN
tara:strand:- start:103993 stop:104817 length:825 start_codon:yes stop_codon:yes gene_type:complete